LIALEYPDSHDLNSSNRLVRTRMPGGVAGAQLNGCLLCRSFKDFRAPAPV